MSLSALDPVAGHVICSLQMLNHPGSASQRLRLGSKQHEAAAADQDLPYASQRLLSSTIYSVFLLDTGFTGLPKTTGPTCRKGQYRSSCNKQSHNTLCKTHSLAAVHSVVCVDHDGLW